MTTALTTLTQTLATRFELGDGSGLIETLKATAFKGQVTDAQMTALLIVANQYGLNPWTKEIYAFPDKNNGIVPVVGVDGWSRIMNGHPQFDGMEFDQDDTSCTCRIFRKDRSRPVAVTEYMSECKRPNVGPWGSHPKRMLRHKAMIQCARLAFGFSGIYDGDEAERIAEVSKSKAVDPDTGEIVVFDVVAAMEAIDQCTTPAEWNAVYKAESAKAVAAKDVAGQNAFKAAAKEKRDAISAALAQDVTDVEVKQ